MQTIGLAVLEAMGSARVVRMACARSAQKFFACALHLHDALKKSTVTGDEFLLSFGRRGAQGRHLAAMRAQKNGIRRGLQSRVAGYTVYVLHWTHLTRKEARGQPFRWLRRLS